METQKNSENNIMLEMKRLLSRMMVQVDYMLRNDREMSRLDFDVMMEYTRDFYGILCDCQLDKQELDDFERKNENTEINEGGELINRDVELEIETPNGDNLNMEEEDKEEYEEKMDSEDKEGEESDEEDVDEEDWEDEEDVSFHVEEPVDNSLAARLQRTPVTDIRTALGINDKMMIINDLFGGSFDRYSKSINALNEFPTLSGAKVYMSELQIELQWDTESQAYKMLNDLVERRFL
ncbi:MAG: hypothetical protein IKS65_04295 [Bacteroidales bacterium]|nr:hypothetical protein [Bacteroidales bacterium]